MLRVFNRPMRRADTGLDMLKYSMLAAVVAMSFGAPAFSQDLPHFDFRGHTIGEQAVDSFPYFKIDPVTCWKKSGLGADKFDESKCPQKIREQPCRKSDDEITYSCDEIPLFAGGKVGDIDVSQLRYFIYDDKIYAVKMLFEARDALKISDMLVGKYGKPTRSETETKQNPAGASFNSLRNEWDFAEGTLVLQQMAGRIDTGMLLFVNTDVEPKIEAIKAQRNQVAGKAAF